MTADWAIVRGHALSLLRRMPDNQIQVGICSPPYYGLRAYKTRPQVWGGDAGCDHRWGEPEPYLGHRGGRGQAVQTKYRSNKTYPQMYMTGGTGKGTLNGSQQTAVKGESVEFAATSTMCLFCGAWRGDLGLEPSPTLFIDHLTEIFREFRRILRPDGLLWIVIGDSYWGSGKGAWKNPTADVKEVYIPERAHRGRDPTLKPKDLVGIPYMLAFALRDDGWYWRAENIWHKPNAMVTSTKDRTTRAHETVLMFSKSRRYYYDWVAIREKTVSGHSSGNKKRKIPEADGDRDRVADHRGTSVPWKKQEYRNARSVWSINTVPYKGPHFATFPPKLVEKMVLASSRPGDIVCDLFCGVATTGVVAVPLGRRFVGLELSKEYAEMGRERLHALGE